MSEPHHGDAAFRVDGLVALVTGGTRGIGQAIAAELAAAGAKVVLTGRERAKAEAAATAIGNGARGIAYDAAEPGAFAALADAIKAEPGRLDILVNNAAILKPHFIEKLTEAEFDALFQVNVKSALFLTKALLPLLSASKAASVTNIGAAGAHAPMAGIGAYCASKAALLNLTRTLAKEWTPRGIRVNAITPGTISTDMILPVDPERRAKFVADMDKTNLMGRLGESIEIARAVRFLASPAASFVTGQILIADGGLLA